MRSKLTNTFAVLFIFMLFFACSKSNDPKDIVRELYASIEKNDVAGVKAKASKSLLGLLNDEKLAKGVEKSSKEIADKKGIKEIKFNDEKVTEEKIDYKITIVYNDGSEKNDKIRLVKEDGEWKAAASK
ncbi:MAG: hypothetical protein Fur0015_13380 [Ignavibacteriales bacterium]